MEIRRYLRALRRGWMVLVLLPVLAGLVAGVVSWRLPPVYEADSSLLVRPAQPLQVQTGTVTETADEITQTYARLMTEPPILEKVIHDLRLNTTTTKLAEDITVTPESNATILDITVSNTNRVLAADIANRLMADFITSMKQVQASENTPGTDQDNFVIVSPAVPPPNPSSPNIARNVVIAALVGLVVAVGAVLLRDYLDQSVKSDEELAERTGLMTIGHVGFAAARKERRGELVAIQDQTPASEAYRSLRTSLLFANIDHPVRTMVVTSSSRDEGKSRTAANLAIVFAQSGRRTLLVDADFRRPCQHRNFGFVRNIGLSNLVLQELEDEQAMLRVDGVPELRVLPSGPAPPNPSELLGSARLQTVISRLGDSFDVVVIDTPPVNAVTDPAVLATFADGVILVIESGRTSYAAVAHAKKMLDQVGANVLGAVVNKVRAGTSSDAYAYESYGYRSADQGTDGTLRRDVEPAPERQAKAATGQQNGGG